MTLTSRNGWRIVFFLVILGNKFYPCPMLFLNKISPDLKDYLMRSNYDSRVKSQLWYDKSVFKMRKMDIKNTYDAGVNYSYLLTITMFMFVFCALGCDMSLPVVRITDISNTGYPISEIKVGKFSVNESEYRVFGNYIEDYLNRRIDKIVLENQKDDESAVSRNTELTVNGELKIIHLAGIDQADLLEARITFQIIDNSLGSTKKMTVLSGRFVDDDHEQARKVIREKVDSFLVMISPESSVIEKVMMRGWTKYDQRGRKLTAKGDYYGAIKAFNKAIDQRPDDHAALYNLGLVLEATGSWHEAMRNYRRAWNIAREDVYRNSYERIHIKMGELNAQ